jgi:hypothetical protein
MDIKPKPTINTVIGMLDELTRRPNHVENRQ